MADDAKQQDETPSAKGSTAESADPVVEAAAAPSAAQAAKTEPVAAQKPVAKPAKPTAAPPSDVSRRGFFSWAAVAWVGFSAAIGGCMTAFNRFMFPNVLFEPPTTFKVGSPDDFPPGVVDERFKEANGVWIINDEGRIYALIAICTHLGCPPNWLEAQNKFRCPCPGSGYDRSGVNCEGPRPRPRVRAKVFVSPEDGQIVVDRSQKYQWELGQWEDPSSFIAG